MRSFLAIMLFIALAVAATSYSFVARAAVPELYLTRGESVLICAGKCPANPSRVYVLGEGHEVIVDAGSGD